MHAPSPEVLACCPHTLTETMTFLSVSCTKYTLGSHYRHLKPLRFYVMFPYSWRVRYRRLLRECWRAVVGDRSSQCPLQTCVGLTTVTSPSRSVGSGEGIDPGSRRERISRRQLPRAPDRPAGRESVPRVATNGAHHREGGRRRTMLPSDRLIHKSNRCEWSVLSRRGLHSRSFQSTLTRCVRLRNVEVDVV